MNSRSISWKRLKELTFPNKPNIRYITSSTDKIDEEIRKINRSSRLQRLAVSEDQSLRRARIRESLDILNRNTIVYRFSGQRFDDRKEIDIDDQGLVKHLVRKLNLDNARVLFYSGSRLIKQVTYNRTSGKRFSTRVFADWIEGNYDEGDNITIFRQTLDEENNGDITLIIQPKSDLKSISIKQRFLDNINKNLHCLFDPIISWSHNKLMELYDEQKHNKNRRSIQFYRRILKIAKEYKNNYPDGGSIEIIRELANKLRINFIIKPVFSIVDNKGEFYYKILSKTKSKITFEYTNTRLNHLEIANDRYLNKNPILLSVSDMELKFKELIKDDKFPLFQQNSKKEYMWISTIDEYYTLDTETKKIYDRFYEENKEITSIDSNSPISNLIRESVHITGQHNIKYPSIVQFKRIDQEKAYANFNQCSYYQGIMNTFTDYRKVNISTDNYIDFLKSHIGIYRVENFDLDGCDKNTKRILRRIKIYKKGSFTSPELIFLLDHKVKFEIKYGTWGVKPIDFKFPDYMYERERSCQSNPRWYSKIVGSMASYNSYKKVQMYGEKRWAEHLKSERYDIIFHEDYDWIQKNDPKCEGDIQGILTTEFKKKKITHKNHIASFITSYARISLLQQLFDIKYNDIYAIITDEIIVKKFSEFKIRNLFREKNSNKPFNKYYSSSFLSYYNLKYEAPTSDINSMTNSIVVCHIGQGGSGKTYSLCTDDGYIDKIYTAPSHKLRKEKEKEFPSINTDVIYNIINNPVYDRKYKYNNPSVIIIDEATQLSKEQLDEVLLLYPYSKILLAGDFNSKGFIYQLPPFQGTKLNISKFTKIIHKGNRRAKDDKLKKILLKYRENILDISGVIKFIKHNLNDQVIKRSEVKNKYSVEDYVLCGTRNIKKKGVKEWNKKLRKLGDKYLIIKNNKNYSKGEVCIITNKIDDLKGKKFAEYRHAFTCHQIQGETIKSKIFIDFNSLFDIYRMFYVAISRAEYMSQIRIII